jgi:hypothetical protein
MAVNCALTPHGENLHAVLLGLNLSAARAAHVQSAVNRIWEFSA